MKAGGAQRRAWRAHDGVPARITSPALKDVRADAASRAGAESTRARKPRHVCERLLARGVLSKDTHRTVVRLAPPLVISRHDLDWALDRLGEVLDEIDGTGRHRKAA